MRAPLRFVGAISLPLLVLLVLLASLACSAGGDKGGAAPIDGGVDATFLDDVSADGGLDDVSLDSSFDGACATASYVAKQAPASMLIVLDRSNTMNQGGKWSSAALAIVSAIDQDGFDTMSLGLMASPSSSVSAPACIGLPIAVACGSPALPQVAVKPAGKDKSSATTGVRHEIYQWLSGNNPDPDASSGSGTPLYEALVTAYKSVRLSSGVTKRLVAFVVNGAASCTSLSSRAGYRDANGCNDWEYPTSLIALIKAAHDDATAPVQTFVIGVPGADTTGSDPTTQPPYHLKLALSAYAKVGSPETVDPKCDGAFKHPGGADPAIACHFDMTSGTLDEKALAANIAKIRGAALGCIYDLPTPPDGSTVDRSKVNVEIDSPSGNAPLSRRKSASDDCATDGCWDYTADGKVELIGKACSDAKALTDGTVKLVVGCATRIK